MRIEFDPSKDAINLAKHGISLAVAADIRLDTARVVPDERRDYGEPRFQAIAAIEGRLHLMIFTVRGDTLRPISLRKANARERKRYEQT